MDPIGDAVVAGGFYGGRWLLNRLRGRVQGSADPSSLPLAEPDVALPSGNIRMVPASFADLHESHVDRVLQRVLGAWDAFLVGDVDIDALRDAVRAGHGALDSAQAEWRDLLDDWSVNLDGLDARVTRYRSHEDMRAELRERFAEVASTVRRHLGPSQ